MAVGNIRSESHYNSLLRRGQEGCALCAKVFKNRFDRIIHNASHLRIPLKKLNCHQCNVCLYYFPTQEDLEDHHEIKHPTIAMNTQNYKVKNRHINVASNINVVTHENGTDDIENNCRQNSLHNKHEDIKEEDLDCDIEIIDITEDDNNFVTADHEYDNFVLKNTTKFNAARLIVDNVRNLDRYNVPVAPEPVCRSEHYTDLTKPEISICKYCYTEFPNRYCLVQHEKIHIRIRRPSPLFWYF